MLDKIFSAAKSELTQQLGSKFQMDAPQADKVFSTAKDSLQSGLMKEATSGNVNGLLSLFNGKASMEANPLVANLVSQLTGSLTSKAGLNQSLASSVGTFVVPLILGKLSSNKPAGGFDVASLTKMLTGTGGGLGDTLKSTLGEGMGDKLGKIFG